MVTTVAIALLVPFVIALLCTHLVKVWALRKGFVDRPAGHKKHQTPVALGGGVAIFIAICGPLLVGTLIARSLADGPPPAWLPELIQPHLAGIASKFMTVVGLIAATAVLHVVGIMDDRRALGPKPKFVVQVLVALFTAAVLGIRIVESLPAPISIIATVLWIVLITNAFNFLDNMDGLSAGVAAIAAAIFAIASFHAGELFVSTMAWVITGALLGFLVFNFSPAKIFMGDAGSLVIGYLMSVLPILTTFYDPARGMTPLGVLVPIVVLAVPLYDVISVVIIRLRAGDSPFRGDWRHFSHRLVKRGMSQPGAVLTIYLATAATGLPAIIMASVGWVGGVLLLVQCLCVVAMIAVLEHVAPAESPEGNAHAKTHGNKSKTRS